MFAYNPECVKEGVSCSRSFSLLCRRLMRGHCCFTVALYQPFLPLHLSFSLAPVWEEETGCHGNTTLQSPWGLWDRLQSRVAAAGRSVSPSLTPSFHLTLSADYSTMQKRKGHPPISTSDSFTIVSHD